MGLMSICPACGSDWCTGCDCVREKLKAAEAEVKRLAQELTDDQASAAVSGRLLARICDALKGLPPPHLLFSFHDLPEFAAQAVAERDRLRAAIQAHRAMKADDRCVEDDDRLYAALGDGVSCDRRVGDKAAMLANCERFIDRRCEGGGWLSYAEQENHLDAARSAVEDAFASFKDGQSPPAWLTRLVCALPPKVTP